LELRGPEAVSRMNSRGFQVRHAVVFALLALAGGASLAASGDGDEPVKPKTPAQRISGRWRIEIQGLPDNHSDILASFAVNGELLEGSLTVERKKVPISAGRISGDRLDIIFHHPGGESIRMKGRVGSRGLEGTWESRDLKGKWSARRLNQ